MDKKTVLALGSAAKMLAEEGYPDFEVTAPDKNKLPKTRKKFDVIISYQTLQLQKNRKVIPYLKSLANMLKYKGVLNIFVPAFEWAAEEVILMEEPSQGIKVHLFGNQTSPDDTYQSLHTMRTLRRDMDAAGFAVDYASRGVYEMAYTGNDGQPVVIQCGQHVVIAHKREGEDAPLKG